MPVALSAITFCAELKLGGSNSASLWRLKGKIQIILLDIKCLPVTRICVKCWRCRNEEVTPALILLHHTL